MLYGLFDNKQISFDGFSVSLHSVEWIDFYSFARKLLWPFDCSNFGFNFDFARSFGDNGSFGHGNYLDVGLRPTHTHIQAHQHPTCVSRDSHSKLSNFVSNTKLRREPWGKCRSQSLLIEWPFTCTITIPFARPTSLPKGSRRKLHSNYNLSQNGRKNSGQFSLQQNIFHKMAIQLEMHAARNENVRLNWEEREGERGEGKKGRKKLIENNICDLKNFISASKYHFEASRITCNYVKCSKQTNLSTWGHFNILDFVSAHRIIFAWKHTHRSLSLNTQNPIRYRFSNVVVQSTGIVNATGWFAWPRLGDVQRRRSRILLENGKLAKAIINIIFFNLRTPQLFSFQQTSQHDDSHWESSKWTRKKKKKK